MEGNTSTSNEGSRNNRSKRANYTEVKAQNISANELDKLLDKKGFDKFDVNCMAVSFNGNIKIIGGDEETITDSNSYGTYEYDLEKIVMNLAPVRDITPEKEPKIKARRKKEEIKRRKQREERENREALENGKADRLNDDEK